jgi:N-acetylglutamate synthase-like GNAT family acetyltransferase
MPDANPESYSIRPARPDEAAALSALAMRSKAHWGYSDEFMAACHDELTWSAEQIDAPQYTFYVCTVENSIVGFHALERLDAAFAELEALFVEPEYIGRGVGKALIEHAKDQARQLGTSSLVIQGDPNAEKFYLAAGAVCSGSRESRSIAGRFLPLFTVDLTKIES